MAKNIWDGDAPAVAMKKRITLSGTIAEGTDLDLTINGKTVSAAATADTAQSLLEAAEEAWNESDIPEFEEITAEAGVDANGDAYLDLTADEEGVPFEVSASGPRPTIDVDTVTAGGAAAGGTNEKQSIVLSNAAGGTWRIQWDLGSGVETSDAIAYNANAAAVQSACLSGMDSLLTGDLSVTGAGTSADPFILELTGSLAATSVAQLTVDASLLTGGGQVNISTITAGGGATGDTLTVEDNFTEASETPLDSHTADSAHTWTTAVGSDLLVNPGGSASGKVGNPDAAGAHAAISSYTGDNDVIIEVPCNVVSTSSASRVGEMLGVVFRAVDANNYWVAGLQRVQSDPGGYFILFLMNFVAGVQDFKSFGAVHLSDGSVGNTYYLRVTASGTAISVDAFSDNGFGSLADSISFTSSTHQAGVGHGMFVYMPTDHGSSILSFGRPDFSLGFNLFTIGTADEVQQIWTNGTGGTFTLTKPSGSTSANIPYNSPAANIATILSALYSGTVTVTGSGTEADPWEATYGGALAGTNVAQVTGDGTNLLTDDVDVTIATTQQGAAGSGAAATVWNIVLTGASGGTYTLAFKDKVTTDLAYDANAAAVQSALQALASVGSGNMTVSGAGSSGSPFVVTCANTLSGIAQPAIVADNTNLTGTGNPTVTITTLVDSRGPLHFDDPQNWSLGHVPDCDEEIVFEQGDTDGGPRYGLRQRATFTVDATANTLILSADFVNGQIVRCTTTNTLPAGLATATDYEVANVDRDAGTLQLKESGSIVDITDAGTGTHTIALEPAKIQQLATFEGQIGLQQYNDSGYREYRATELAIGLAADGVISLGQGDGNGSGLVRISTGGYETYLEVISSGGSVERNVPAAIWRGTHADNIIDLFDGDLGIASFVGQTAVWKTYRQRGGRCVMGEGVSAPSSALLDKTAGELLVMSTSLSGTIKIRG